MGEFNNSHRPKPSIHTGNSHTIFILLQIDENKRKKKNEKIINYNFSIIIMFVNHIGFTFFF